MHIFAYLFKTILVIDLMIESVYPLSEWWENSKVKLGLK